MAKPKKVERVELERRFVPGTCVPWKAAGPGWANGGVTAKVHLIEQVNGVIESRQEDFTVYWDKLPGSVHDAAVILNAELERVVEREWRAEQKKKRD